MIHFNTIKNLIDEIKEMIYLGEQYVEYPIPNKKTK